MQRTMSYREMPIKPELISPICEIFQEPDYAEQVCLNFFLNGGSAQVKYSHIDNFKKIEVISALNSIDTKIKETQAIIICQTREEIIELKTTFNKINESRNYCSVESIASPITDEVIKNKLQSKPQILIIGPQRLLWAIQNNTINLSMLKLYIISADEHTNLLLDEIYNERIQYIISQESTYFSGHYFLKERNESQESTFFDLSRIIVHPDLMTSSYIKVDSEKDKIEKIIEFVTNHNQRILIYAKDDSEAQLIKYSLQNENILNVSIIKPQDRVTIIYGLLDHTYRYNIKYLLNTVDTNSIRECMDIIQYGATPGYRYSVVNIFRDQSSIDMLKAIKP